MKVVKYLEIIEYYYDARQSSKIQNEPHKGI